MGLAVLLVQLSGDIRLNCHHEWMRSVITTGWFPACEFLPLLLFVAAWCGLALPCLKYAK
jgi:hypothetical protein